MNVDEFIAACAEVGRTHIERAAAITEVVSKVYADAHRTAQARLEAMIPPAPAESMTAALSQLQRKQPMPNVTTGDLGLDDFDDDLQKAAAPAILGAALSVAAMFGYKALTGGAAKSVDQQIDRMKDIGEGTKISIADSLTAARDGGLTVGEAQDIVDRLGRMADYAAEDIGHGEATAIGGGITESTAIDEGLDAYKGWLTVGDDAVREDHAAAEDQVVSAGEMFNVGGEDLAFPRDPNGSPENVINCRCFLGWAPTLAAAESGDWTALTEGDEGATSDQSVPEFQPPTPTGGDVGEVSRSEAPPVNIPDTTGRTALDYAKGLVADAKTIEPDLTAELTSAAADRDMTMQGLDFRLKSEESMARKIAGDATEKDISLEQAADGINDAVRYTMIGEPDELVAQAQDVLAELRAKGWDTRIKNTWAHPITGTTPYRGINVVLTDEHGVSFELQFHTADSFYTKEYLAHPLYEEARLLDKGTARYKELIDQMDAMGDRLEFPRGASEWGFDGDGTGVPHGQGVDLFMSRWEARGVDSYLSENDQRIVLSKVIVPASERGSGIGTKFMEDLTRYADQAGKRIDLSPSVDFGATSKGRLVDFYKQFGFVENKGKNLDHAISEAMYRLPKELPPLPGIGETVSETETALREAKTLPDIQKILTDKWGTGSNRPDGRRVFSFKGMSPDSAREIAIEFDRMMTEYPETAERVHMLGSVSGLNTLTAQSKLIGIGRAYADSYADEVGQRSGTSWIRFNTSKTKDFEKVSAELLRNQETGWTMEGDLKGTLRHEFGHQIDGLAREHDEQGYLDALREVMRGHTAADLSTYAADSMKEMVAEAISSATGDHPTDLAKAIYDVVLRYSEKWAPAEVEQAATEAGIQTAVTEAAVEQSEIGKVADAIDAATRPGFNAIEALRGIDSDGMIAERLHETSEVWQSGHINEMREAYSVWLNGGDLAETELVQNEVVSEQTLDTFFTGLRDATSPDFPLYRGMTLQGDQTMIEHDVRVDMLRSLLEKGEPFDLPQTLSSFSEDPEVAKIFGQNTLIPKSDWIRMTLVPGKDADALNLTAMSTNADYANEQEWLVGGNLRVTEITKAADGSWDLTVEAITGDGYPMPELPPPAVVPMSELLTDENLTTDQIEEILKGRYGDGSDRGNRVIAFEGLASGTAREASVAFDEMMEEFPKTGQRVELFGSSKGLASYSGFAMSNPIPENAYADAYPRFYDKKNAWIRINTTKGAEYERLAAAKTEGAAVGWSTTDDFAGTIRHEFGHHMDYFARVNAGGTSLRDNAYVDEINKAIAGHNVESELSMYATTDLEEMVAEAIAQATGPHPSPLAKQILDVVLKYTEKWEG